MTKEFVINNSVGRRAMFTSSKFGNRNELETYKLTLESPMMQAFTYVENPPYGVSLSGYFQELADNWRGWEGVKKWNALEGELSIESTMSKLGHVSFIIRMNVYGVPSDWIAIAEFDIEAGQLAKLAEDARHFFEIN